MSGRSRSLASRACFGPGALALALFARGARARRDRLGGRPGPPQPENRARQPVPHPRQRRDRRFRRDPLAGRRLDRGARRGKVGLGARRLPQERAAGGGEARAHRDREPPSCARAAERWTRRRRSCAARTRRSRRASPSSAPSSSGSRATTWSCAPARAGRSGSRGRASSPSAWRSARCCAAAPAARPRASGSRASEARR